MYLLNMSSDVLVPITLLTLPALAIMGGIISGVLRQLGRQRLIELAQQERITALQRGVDPAQLPPYPLEVLGAPGFDYGFEGQRRRAQNLMIGGLISVAGGAGLLIFLMMMRVDSVRPVWAVGLIPILVGAALLLSAAVVYPRDRGTPGPR